MTLGLSLPLASGGGEFGVRVGVGEEEGDKMRGSGEGEGAWEERKRNWTGMGGVDGFNKVKRRRVMGMGRDEMTGRSRNEEEKEDDEDEMLSTSDTTTRTTSSAASSADTIDSGESYFASRSGGGGSDKENYHQGREAEREDARERECAELLLGLGNLL
jgi:hypothetical protein